MDRLWRRVVGTCAVVLAFACLGFGAPAAGAAEAEDPAEVAAQLPTPSCAEGPRRDGDVIVGTDCADRIVVPPTVTYVDGGPGDDTIIGSQSAAATPTSCPSGCHLLTGSQTFEGGEGDDLVYGDRGNDILRGNAGDDRLYGGIGDDRLEGGPGNDWLSGGFGADTIDGGEGGDYVRGDATIDHIYDTGTSGTDTLSFATGVTPGFTGEANPTGATNFPGPTGERGVWLKLGEAVEVNALDNGPSLGGGNDVIVQPGAFERIIGTPFSDYIVGTGAAEEILGGGGADVIKGGGGADVLRGGADGDYLEDGSGATLDGEAGTDGCSETGATRVECDSTTKAVHPRPGATVSVGEVAAGSGSFDVYVVGDGGAGTATAIYKGPTEGNTVEIALSAGAHFDTEPAEAAGCTLSPASEPTLAKCPFGAPAAPNVPPLDAILLAGMGGNDHITASGFPDGTGVIELGGEGSDTLKGGASEDVLVDGQGTSADTLEAFAGDDALLHNGGADRLDGGEGSDLFLSVSICDGETIDGGIAGPGDRDNASWARYETGGGVYADIETGEVGEVVGESLSCAGGTPDRLEGIEDLEGSNGSDILVGDGNANQILGHAGEDTYQALGGDDTIFANSGSRDRLIDCGEGTDSAVIDLAAVGDPAPIECETVREGTANEFRTEIEEPPPAPVVLPPVSQPQTVVPTPAKTKKPKPDRTPPRTRLVGQAGRVLRVAHGRRAALAIRFAAGERSHFECKLDGHPYRACHSPDHLRLTPGRHTFRVYAIDAAGNRDRTPALLRLRVLARRR